MIEPRELFPISSPDDKVMTEEMDVAHGEIPADSPKMGEEMPTSELSRDKIREEIEKAYQPLSIEKEDGNDGSRKTLGFNGFVPGGGVDQRTEIGTKTSTRKSRINKLFVGAKTAVAELYGGKRARIRRASFNDLDNLVEVDIKSFDSVYREYEVDEETWKDDLMRKFAGRLHKVKPWVDIFERDGEIAGFMTSCPTNKRPEDFVSWEDTTDDGTLETTYDPNGERIYVVSLSMLPSGSEVKGQNMLFAHQIGRFIRKGYKEAFFESRMPGLLSWAKKYCKDNEVDFNNLTNEQTDVLAQQYFGLKKEIDGKEVPYDRLLRIFASVGCRFVKVAPNAYNDRASMNYGVVCVYDNPLPDFLRNNRIARNVVGGLLQLIARSPYITKKIF